MHIIGSDVDQDILEKINMKINKKMSMKDFYHKNSNFSVEFPGSQLIIGDEPMKPEGKIKKGKFILKLLSPSQCVMDRLSAFYHWKDRQSLEQAVMVARKHPVKLRKIKMWSTNEGMEDRYEIFLDRLKDSKE